MKKEVKIRWFDMLWPRRPRIYAENNSLASAGNINIHQNISLHLDVPTAAVPEGITLRVKRFTQYHVGTEEHPVPFGGRGQQLSALNKWLAEPAGSCNNLLIVGPMGRGKTSLLLHWIGQIDHVWQVAFMPINLASNLTSEADFYHGLAGRLALILGKELSAAWVADPATFYRNQVVELMTEVRQSARRCLVVVDGLDEVDWRLDPAALPLSTTPTLKIVAGARVLGGDEDAAGWQRQLQWDYPPGKCRTLPLPALDELGVQDVVEKWAAASAVKVVPAFISTELFRLTAGDALLLSLYLKELADGFEHRSTAALEELGSFAPGYQSFFSHCWDVDQLRREGDSRPFEQKSVKAILAVLACARGPMKLAALDRIASATSRFGLQHPISQQDLSPIRRWLVGDGINLGYSFSHPKLAAYFRDEHFGAGQIIQEVHAAILQWGRETVRGLKSGEIGPTYKPEYEYLLLHYCAHAIECGVSKDELIKLVDAPWMLAWRRYEGGYRGFASDVSSVLMFLRRMRGDQLNSLFFFIAEIRCILCLSTICGLGSNIPKELLAAALQEDFISLQEAKHLAEIRPSEERAATLAAIFDRLPPIDRTLTVELIERIQGPNQLHYWLRILPHLDVASQHLMLRKFLSIIGATTDANQQQHILLELAPFLEENERNGVIDKALRVATLQHDVRQRAMLMANVCPFLSREKGEELRAEILMSLKDVTKADRFYLLSYLLAKFPEQERSLIAGMLLATALNDINALDTQQRNNEFLMEPSLLDIRTRLPLAYARMVRLLPASQRKLASEKTIQAVTSLPAGFQRVTAMTEVAMHLDEPFRSSLNETCHQEILALPSGNNRLHSLVRLIPMLSAGVRRQAISEAFQAAEVEAIETEADRTDYWVRLAKAMSPQQRDRFFAPILQRILDHDHGVRYNFPPSEDLLSLASAEQRLHICQYVVSTIRNAPKDFLIAHSLARFIPSIPAEMREEAVNLLLSMCKLLASRHDPISLGQLSAAIGTLSAADRFGLIEESFQAVCRIEDAYQRSSILASFIPHCSGDFQAQTINEAVRGARSITSRQARARMLAEIADHLPEADRAPLMLEAKAWASSLADSSARQRLLAELEVRPRRADKSTGKAPGAGRMDVATSLKIVELELDACSKIPRRNALDQLIRLAPKLFDIGGDELLLAIAKEIRDTAAWWRPDVNES